MPPTPHAQTPKDRPRPAISLRLPTGELAELVLDKSRQRTAFAVWDGAACRLEDHLEVSGERLVPYSPANNLIRHEAVLLPSGAEEFGTVAELVAEVQRFIHAYVDLSPTFEAIAVRYVLLSWRYDAFAELPYLRVRGDAGSGKTRFLLTVGSLCYKPILASGASTVSPLFRILDAFRGTLVLDESDFRVSDEKAEVVKILNNGNARGFPVLRSEVLRSGEVNPVAFHVFGPKLIATRGYFDDRALESRCITEELGQYGLRLDVPISLPPEMADQALLLRNKLLTYRFRTHGSQPATVGPTGARLEPRLRQVFAPLLAVTEDEETRGAILNLAAQMHRDGVTDRGMDIEAHVLQTIREAVASGVRELGIGDLARAFAVRYPDDADRPMTPKWLGFILRRRLRLRTEKRHGVFVIADGEHAKLPRLLERYGLEPLTQGSPEPVALSPEDLGDLGDVSSATSGDAGQEGGYSSAPDPTGIPARTNVPEVPDIPNQGGEARLPDTASSGACRSPAPPVF